MSTGISTGAFLSDTVKARATQREKEAKDFERQKEIMDHLDIYYTPEMRDYKKIEKFKINFELLNGYLDVKLYEDPLCFDVPTGKTQEQISFDFQNISHTPLIAQYANAIIGEQVIKPFKPMIKDHTPNRATMMKRKAAKINRQFILESVVGPIRDQIMNNILQQAGQTDVFNYANNPEAQMQLEQQINAQLQTELPKDIMDFINGDVQSVTAKQAQKMTDFIVERFNISYEQIKGFKNAVATGEEYYYAGEYKSGLMFRAENPMYIEWGGGDKQNEWIQHADWVRRENWLSYQQLVSNHSDKLSKKDLDIIDLDIEPVGGFYKGVPFWDKDASHTKKLMWTYGADEGFRNAFSDININTKEGRKKLFNMYDLAFGRYADEYGRNYADYGIREAHFQWRDLRKMWVVKRQMQDGRIRQFWLPEHYEPTHLDLDIKEVWINQVWEGWKLGTFDAAYVGIREVPYQYKSIFNPHDVDLSYYGKRYNTHDNSVRNVSLVDLGKSAQKSFDMVLASIRQDMATNHGKAFTLFMNMKPEGWTYQQWLDMLRNAGILMIDPSRNTAGIDPQFLREIDLSKMSDIAGKIQMLEFYRQQVALSMYFNDAREGAISQYANATNVQQNSLAVHNKTAFFMEQHRMVVEKALGGFLNRARHYYRENIEEASIFLDDTDLADLQNAPLSWYEWLGVQLKNSEAELQKLEALKQQMLAFIQNGSTPEAVMELIFADTITEVTDIVRRETKRQEQQRQQEFQQQMEMQQQQIQAQQADKQAEMQLEWQKHISELESQEKRTLWDREKFAMQNDVDENKINDMLQKTLLELQAKMQMNDKDLDFKREEMELKEKLEMEKLKNERMKFKIPTTSS
jgi:hypothetical protein